MNETLVGLFSFAIVAIIYFLPTYVAFRNKKKSVVAICALNILTGWTFVGWVISLVWALVQDESKTGGK